MGKVLKPGQIADADADARARRTPGLGRRWWRRALRILWAPGGVLAVLREADEDDEAARQEPILAVVILAGMAAILMMGGALVDDSSIDLAVAAVMTYIGGAIYGGAGYLVLGLGVLVGVRGGGGETTFKQARHLVAFSAVPIALSFVLLAPTVTLAYGRDYFVERGSDSSRWVVLAIGLPFVVWSAALLAAGFRVTYRLSWAGVAAATALAAVFVAAFVTVPTVL